MSITFKQEHLSFTNDPETTIKYVVHDDGIGLDQIFQEFRHFLLACGYAPEGVNKYVEPA